MIQVKTRLDTLVSPAFVSALLLLVVNDHFLKYSTPGWFTGKLSDFTGLYVFALFFFALFPNRTAVIVGSTALLFVFWKFPLSQSLIDFFNKLNIISISRTVDYSDLIALLSLPVAHKTYCTVKKHSAPKFVSYFIGFVALLAIAGTSVIHPRYSYQFIFSDEPSPSLVSIQDAVNDAVLAQHFRCVDCATEQVHRRYERRGVWLNTNFDVYTNTLFVQVIGPDREETKKTTDEVVSAFSSKLNLISKEIVVKQYEGVYLTRPHRSSLQVQLSEGILPFCLGYWSEPQISSLFEKFQGYAKSAGFTDLGHSPCAPTGGLCRSYRTGRVYGADAFARSTKIEVFGQCSWGGWSIRVDIEQSVEDSTIDFFEIIRNLRDFLATHTGREVVIP